MDFASLLNTASDNAKKLSKTVGDLEADLEKERREKIKKSEAEKRMREEKAKRIRSEAEKERARRAAEEAARYCIPKKKKTEPTVDSSQIQAYLNKKAEEKRQQEKEEQAKKDRLLQLRLQQSFGGKAGKKLGKQFGMNPIDIQIRYGNDHEHIERLQKLQAREQEEAEMLADQYRGGVYKAIAEKKKKLEEAVKNRGNQPVQPHRVSTSKSNSLAGLSSRHAANRDHFSPPRETHKEKKSAPKVESRKRPPPPTLDFGTLMKAAEDISQGKKVKLELNASAPPPKKSDPGPSSSSSRPSSSSMRPSSSSSISSSSTAKSLPAKPVRPVPVAPTKPSSFSRLPEKQNSSSSHHSYSSQSKKTPVVSSTSAYSKRPSSECVEAVRKVDNGKDRDDKSKSKKDEKGRFVKKASPPPLIPPAIPGKRYLPGDVRYKPEMGSSSQNGRSNMNKSMMPSINKGLPSASAPREPKPDIRSKVADVRKDRERERDRERAPRQRDEREDSAERPSYSVNKITQREKIRQRKEAEYLHAKRERERQQRERDRERDRGGFFRRGDYSDDDDEEEDDYDSEMDDFIDDTGMDVDEFSRQELEETLKMVNPKYNKKRWRERERMIDDRQMVADYRTVAKEEARSARLGLMEDLVEAKKGNSFGI